MGTSEFDLSLKQAIKLSLSTADVSYIDTYRMLHGLKKDHIPAIKDALTKLGQGHLIVSLCDNDIDEMDDPYIYWYFLSLFMSHGKYDQVVYSVREAENSGRDSLVKYVAWMAADCARYELALADCCHLCQMVDSPESKATQLFCMAIRAIVQGQFEFALDAASAVRFSSLENDVYKMVLPYEAIAAACLGQWSKVSELCDYSIRQYPGSSMSEFLANTFSRNYRDGDFPWAILWYSNQFRKTGEHWAKLLRDSCRSILTNDDTHILDSAAQLKRKLPQDFIAQILGKTYLNMQQPDNAAAQLRIAVEHHPSQKNISLLSTALLDMDKAAESRKVFSAIKTYSIPEAYVVQIRLLMESRDYDGALQECENCLENFSCYALILLLKAEILDIKGQYEEAIDALLLIKQYLAITYLPKFWHKLSSLYEKQGMDTEAEMARDQVQWLTDRD